MPIWKKILTALLFTLLLAGLGGADAYVLRNEHVLPSWVSGQGIRPESGPDMAQIIEDIGLTPVEGGLSAEQSLLARVPLKDATVHSLTLSRGMAPVILLSWVESPDVKEEFSALKTSLTEAFSPQVSDVEDTTRNDLGHPVSNILRFRDPGISPDRIIIVRVQNRLYEVHITAGNDDIAAQLVRKLVD